MLASWDTVRYNSSGVVEGDVVGGAVPFHDGETVGKYDGNGVCRW